MENRINSFVRVAVAGVAVLAGAAILNTASAQSSSTDVKSTTIMADTGAPAPGCDPRNPNCKMPNMGW